MMRTLKTRLLVAVFLAMLVVIVGAFFAGVGLNQASLEASTIAQLEERVAGFAAMVQQEDLAALDPLAAGIANAGERLEILPLTQVETLLPPGAARDLTERRTTAGSVTVAGLRYVYAAVPSGDHAIALLRPFREEPTLIPGSSIGVIVGFGLFAAAVAGVLAILVTGTVTRPMQRVAEAGRALASGEHPEPVPIRGPRELRALGASFNEMAERLDRAREAEKSFFMSVSHELKTPIAVVRGYAEGLRDGILPVDEAAPVILDEAERLDRLVQDILELARIDQKQFSARDEVVDLAHVTERVIQRHTPQAAAASVELRGQVVAPATAVGDADRIVQAVSNLVENALRVTPAGGAVTVRAGAAQFGVDDEGPGLTPDEMEHAFERFFLHRRFESLRPVGSGLGLALVKELVEAMGGSVGVTSTPPRGATFTISLRSTPRTDAPGPGSPAPL